MEFYDRLVKNIEQAYEHSSIEIIDACICLRYTYALIRIGAKEYLGLSHTFIDHLRRRPPNIEFINPADLVKYILSSEPYERQIGFALLNAYSQYLYDKTGSIDLDNDVDASDAVDISDEDVVLFIGDIRPLVERVRGRAREVLVLEDDPCRRSDSLPGTYISFMGSRADIAFITGSALVNGSMDYVLSMTSRAREKVLVGPTAQLHPAFLKDTGITRIAGCYVMDPEKVISGLKLGHGTRWILRYSRKFVVDVRGQGR